MARVFSTQLKLDSDRNLEDFLALGKLWIVNSPHTKLRAAEIAKLENHGDKAQREGHYLELGRVKQDNCEIAGIQHICPGLRGDLWKTTAVASKSEKDLSTAITIEYEASNIKLKLPACKKPHLLKLLMERIGGGKDGDLTVRRVPFMIPEGRGDEYFVADILKGNTKTIMPVVYVSAVNENNYLVNPNELSERLSGIAHVLVEPSKLFSLKLRDQTQEKNVFGGAIGIYWADGYNRFFWNPKTLNEYKQKGISPVENIFGKLVELLNSKKVPKELSWENMQSLHNMQKIQTLRAEKEKISQAHKEGEDMILKLYTDQLDTVDKQLKESEEENADLERRLRALTLSRQSGNSGGFMQVPSSFKPIYDKEARTIAKEVLENSLTNIQQGSRREKFVRELVSSIGETSSEEKEKYIERIKNLFKNYDGMTAPLRSELQDMGFDILDTKGHYKLVRTNDPDGFYSTLSKTPSDWRSGKNMSSQIIRTFF